MGLGIVDKARFQAALRAEGFTPEEVAVAVEALEHAEAQVAAWLARGRLDRLGTPRRRKRQREDEGARLI